MTTYYVSQQVGNDLNPGTGPGVGQAWATLGKANDQALAAGDVIRVGPGTYRQKLVLNDSGAGGNPILWVADPECQYLTSDKPGIVRWTATDASEIHSAISALDFGSTTNVEVYNFVLDGSVVSGTPSKGTVNRGSGSYDASCKIVDCLVFGFYAATYVYALRCILFGRTATEGVYGDNCIAFGGTTGFYLPKTGTRGCKAVACNTGFNAATEAPTLYNCLAIGGSAGLSGSNATFTNCHAAYCNVGFTGTRVNCTASGCLTNSSGGSGSVPTTAVVLLPNFDLLKRALEPLASLSLYNAGDDAHAPSTPELLGRPRQMGVVDIGPYELASWVLGFGATDYQSNPPGVKITGIGQVVVQVSAKAGVAVTAKVQTKHDGATTKPEIQLKGKTIATQTATNSQVADVWQQLTVAATPTINEVLELVFYGQEAAKIAWFSDVDLS